MKKSFLLKVMLVAMMSWVTQISTAQTINTFAGNGTAAFSGNGGTATAASLNFPNEIVLDNSGNVYVADRNNNVVRMINTSGIISTFAGTGVAGSAGDGGAATSAQLNSPLGLTIDALGNIYISEFGGNKVRKVNTSGIISTFAGTGTGGFSGDGGAATSALLNQPAGLGIDASGNIYITDCINHRIRRVSTTGIISTYAGIGTPGTSGDGGAATSAAINTPYDIAINAAGEGFIADAFNFRIRKISTSGTISTFATGLGNYPVSIVALGTDIYASYLTPRVWKITSAGATSVYAGTGSAGFSGDGGPATSANLTQPRGLAFNAAGELFIGDAGNNRIRKVSSPCTNPTIPTVSASSVINCGTLATNLNIASGTLNSATEWRWYSGSCGGTVEGTGTSVTVSPNTTTTYYVRGEGGCVTPGSCANITITVNQPTSSTTNQSVCADALPYTWNGLTFSTAGSQTAHLTNAVGCDSAATLNLTVKQLSSSTTSISICANELPYAWNGLTFSTAGSQTAHLTNAAGCDSAATLNLTVKQLSSSTTSISICANALPYTWNGLTFTTAGSQTEHFTNAVGCDSAATLNLTVNPLPSTPAETVIQPTCAIATGTINVTAPLGEDYSYSIGGAYQSNPSFATVNPGTYTLSVQSTAGCFAALTTSVTVDPQPFIPAAPTTTGFTNVCPYTGTVTQITYTASAVGATSYTWSIPPTNVTMVSGQGTANLTVTFGSGFPVQNNKQFRVSASSACGTSPLTIFSTFTQQPNTASPITGPTSVCELIGTSSTATYKIPAVTAATEYGWSIPAGTTITHPNGTGVNDTIVRLTFLPNFTGGNISVITSNNCGTGGTRTLAIGYVRAATPGLISGSTNACAYMAPNGVAATYSVVPVAGATSYTWTTPAGSIVTHPNGAGANDYTITVLYPGGFSSGIISVSATNGCGTSSLRTLSITKLNPATPGVPDIIQTGFCGEAGGRVYSYTLASMPANATSVLWTVPTTQGAILLSGQGTASIMVSYPSTAINGLITTQAVSNCASSTIRSTTIKMGACAETFAKGIVPAIPVRGSRNGATTTKADAAETMQIKVFPNPTINDFKVQVSTTAAEKIYVRISDMQGRMLKQFVTAANQINNIGADLKAGTYILEIRQGTTVKTTKLVKF